MITTIQAPPATVSLIMDPDLYFADVLFGYDTRRPLPDNRYDSLTLRDTLLLGAIASYAAYECKTLIDDGYDDCYEFGFAITDLFGGELPAFDGLPADALNDFWGNTLNLEEWLGLARWTATLAAKLSAINS
jgi:hypothetical protein